MSPLLGDLQYSVRSLRRRPTFVAVAVVTLALGVGANTAIFSVLNSVVLSPLPYHEPERLVRLYQVHEDQPPDQISYVTGPDFVDYRDRTGVFESLACMYTYREAGFDLTRGDRPRRIRQLPVSSGYFELLGAGPVLGRSFSREEERTGVDVVVMSHRLWQEHFGGDPGCLGRSLILDGLPWTVIGVMPEAFRNPVGGETDIWTPQDLEPGEDNRRGSHYLTVLGRLGPSTTLERAQAELDVLSVGLAEQYAENEGWYTRLVSLHKDVVGDSSRTLYVLLGAVFLLLLIGCVNVANLFMAQGASRVKELAIRSALGSGRARLVRQQLAEVLVIALLGGVAGLLLAFLGIEALHAFRPESLPRIDEISFDGRLFLFAAGLTLATVAIFALVPALRFSRPDLNRCLREEGRGISGGVQQRRLRSALVISEVSLALVLLIGAGLLLRSFIGLRTIDLGFSSENVLSFQIYLPRVRYEEPEKRIILYQHFFERMEGVAGVRTVGSIHKPPVSGEYHIWWLNIKGYPEYHEGDPWRLANFRCVNGRYFEAMNIRLHRGRLLDDRDRTDTQPVAVVNNALVRRYFPDSDPLGEFISVYEREWEIVGIAQDVLYDHREPAADMVYLPHNQWADVQNWYMTFVISTANRRVDVLGAARHELEALDPDLIIHNVRTMEQVAGRGIAEQQFAMLLMGAFAIVALLLAAVGIYGILSHSVNQRTREIGIRMALGADVSDVRRWVVKQGLTVVLVGIAAGIVGALALTHLLSSLVYDVSTTDPITFIAVVIALVIIAWIAGYVPARRATRVDPMIALRQE